MWEWCFFITAPVAPMNVMAEQTSQTTVRVSWSRLNLVEARGFVTLYTVTYASILTQNRERQASYGIAKQVTTSAEASNVTVKGMDGDAYRLTVSASTIAGTGESSVSMEISMEDRSDGSPHPQKEGSSEGLIGSIIGVPITAVLLVVVINIIIVLK